MLCAFSGVAAARGAVFSAEDPVLSALPLSVGFEGAGSAGVEGAAFRASGRTALMAFFSSEAFLRVAAVWFALTLSGSAAVFFFLACVFIALIGS